MCNPAFLEIRGMAEIGTRRKGKGRIEVRRPWKSHISPGLSPLIQGTISVL